LYKNAASFLYIFQVSHPSDEARCSLVTVSEAKQTQRKAGRAARKALGPEERKAANAALCAFLWQLAAVQKAQTILLDEATASLDPENEVEVQRAINTLIAGRTVIVIAHRLKTIRNADNIVVLDQGRIAEQGTHDQLVAHGGLYARLWAIQERTAGWSITS